MPPAAKSYRVPVYARQANGKLLWCSSFDSYLAPSACVRCLCRRSPCGLARTSCSPPRGSEVGPACLRQCSRVSAVFVLCSRPGHEHRMNTIQPHLVLSFLVPVNRRQFHYFAIPKRLRNSPRTCGNLERLCISPVNRVQEVKKLNVKRSTCVGLQVGVACDARVGQCILHAPVVRSLPVASGRSVSCLDVKPFSKDFRHCRHLASSYEDSLRTCAWAQGPPLEEATEEKSGVVSRVSFRRTLCCELCWIRSRSHDYLTFCLFAFLSLNDIHPLNYTRIHYSSTYSNPFRAAVPFWGQTTLIPSSLSPNRDCNPERVVSLAQQSEENSQLSSRSNSSPQQQPSSRPREQDETLQPYPSKTGISPNDKDIHGRQHPRTPTDSNYSSCVLIVRITPWTGRTGSARLRAIYAHGSQQQEANILGCRVRLKILAAFRNTGTLCCRHQDYK